MVNPVQGSLDDHWNVFWNRRLKMIRTALCMSRKFMHIPIINFRKVFLTAIARKYFELAHFARFFVEPPGVGLSLGVFCFEVFPNNLEERIRVCSSVTAALPKFNFKISFDCLITLWTQDEKISN